MGEVVGGASDVGVAAGIGPKVASIFGMGVAVDVGVIVGVGTDSVATVSLGAALLPITIKRIIERNPSATKSPPKIRCFLRKIYQTPSPQPRGKNRKEIAPKTIFMII